MRAIFLSLILVACGKGSTEQPVAAGSAKPVEPTKPVTPPARPPSIVAVLAHDHLKILALAPTGITVQRDVKLPSEPDDFRWIDHEHLVTVDLDGKAYLVTGDTVAPYQMPPASAWKAKAGEGETAAKFPTKLTLTRTAAGVELASCESYYMGDDDPCVTWGVVTLDTSLKVGVVTTRTDVPTDDAVEPEIKSSLTPAIEWVDNADGMHTKVVLKLDAAKREWPSEEPCPLTDAHIKWLSPAVFSFITTSDCGEGGPNDEEHLLRAPALTDFSPATSTLVIAPDLWARGSEKGWTLLSGEREVGALDGVPVPQPTTEPVAPTPVTPTAATSRLALHRGEKLHVPKVEVEWHGMHATVVDVIYKKARAKPPISKLVLWNAGERFDIARSARACDAYAELGLAKGKLVFRCASKPVGSDPEGMIEDWLVGWKNNKPRRFKHWAGDPAAAEPAWAK